MRRKKRLEARAVTRVFGYMRVSTHDQAERYSLPAQKERIEAYCKAMCWPAPTDTGWFTDEESGKVGTRSEYQRMLEGVSHGLADAVVFTKVDRWMRNVKQQLIDLDDVFEANGCRLCVIEQSINTGTAAGRFALTMFGAVAEYEGNVIIERTTQGKTQHATAKGTHWGGIAPYGYRQGDQVGTLKIFEPEAQVVREVFRLARLGKPVTEIQRRLLYLGSKPRVVQEKDETGVRQTRQPDVWHRQTIHNILRREDFYRGSALVVDVPLAVGVNAAHPPILVEDNP